MSRLLVLATVFLLVISVSKPLFAKDDNVYLYADSIISDMSENYVYATGNVYVTLGENSLWTDSLLFDKKTDTIYAFNKAVFYGNFIAHGEYLKFNIKTKEGYLSKGEVSFLSDDPKKKRFIWGSDIIIKDKESFFISEGGISSCDGTNKAWHIQGADINVELGEYLTSRNTTLYASSMPVLYTPYFLIPIKKERESGFLIPSIGFSGKNGVLFNLPYYTVINDSLDITNTLLIKSKTSIGIDNQFRYMLSSAESGEVNLTLIDNFSINKGYVEAKLIHSKENSTENFKIDLDYVNRKDFFTQYATNSFDKTKPYTRSSGFYEFARKRDLYSGKLFFSQDNTGVNDDVRSFSLSKEGYLKQHGDFGYNYSAMLSAFSYSKENTVKRVAFEPFVMYRLTGEEKGLSAKLKLHLADYINAYEDQDNQLSGMIYTNIEGYLDKVLLVNDKYKVINTFKVDTVLPYKLDDEKIRMFDSTDITDDTKKVKYAFEQKWYDIAKLKQQFYLTLWQEYILSDMISSNNKFSDLFFLMRFSKDVVNIDAQGSYDHNKGGLRELNLALTTNLQGFKASANYFVRDGQDEFLNLYLSKKLGYNTTIIAGTRYDIKLDLAREVSVGIDYEKSCYSVKMLFTHKDLPEEDIVMLTVNLFGLGEFKQGY